MQTTYHNPVYNHPFADPFALKYKGEYWAYCTGIWRDGGWFGILRSHDLVQWEEIGSAMEPLPGNATCLWAPEVTYANGHFYLYYSYGNEVNMEIRVAVAEHPAGPFIDSGRRLTSEPFTIDPHVFTDDDGACYLFYATDFLEHTHIGTGTVRDRLLDPFTLEGHPVPVTRARYDWQVYDPQRTEKGGVRWHTIEGSFVLKRKGRYYQMFSGGNWQNTTYGVSYGTTDRIDTPDEWTQHADGERVLPILQTVPGQVIGPGHNSVVRGPDNRQLFCVYHRWNMDVGARVLAIDPLDWAGDRMLVLGPTTTPQPAPNRATFADWFDEEHDAGLGPNWTCAGGQWRTRDGAAIQRADAGEAAAQCAVTAPCFVAEISVRALEQDAHGGYGVSVGDEVFFLLEPSSGRIVRRARQEDGHWNEQHLTMPTEFNPCAYHLLRIEVNVGNVTMFLDEGVVRWSARLSDGVPHALALRTYRLPAAFAGFALTEGWEDLFTGDELPAATGWHTDSDDWHVSEGQLLCTGDSKTLALKGPLPDAYELVVNVRLLADTELGGYYGIYPAAGTDALGPCMAIMRDGTEWALICQTQERTQTFALPNTFDPFTFQQFRFQRRGKRLSLQWEAVLLGEVEVSGTATHVGLSAAQAAFDMVRVTRLMR